MPNSNKVKAEYVKRQTQSREHYCHWPGCNRQVKPAMWGCKEHWFKLPPKLRYAIWAAYRPGQEKDMRPSKKYLEVAHEAQIWIYNYLKEQKNGTAKSKGVQKVRSHRKKDG